MITKFYHVLHLHLEVLQQQNDSYEIEVLGREHLSTMPTPVLPHMRLYLFWDSLTIIPIAFNNLNQ